VGYYKKSKYWAEQEAFKAVQRGQDIVIVNPSTPIGAFDIKPTPTSDIILRFLRRKMPAYVNTGLNLIDVRDVAWGHLLALEKGRTGERYILGHQNTSLKTLLTELAEITSINAPKIVLPFWIPLLIAWLDEKVLPVLGKSPSIPLDGVKMSKQSMYYDSSKAVQELGLPQSPIRQALADAIDWFQTNGDITY
jgi:dihydroflavonol-4-reductase